MNSTGNGPQSPVDAIQSAIIAQIESYEREEEMLASSLYRVRDNLDRLRAARSGIAPTAEAGEKSAMTQRAALSGAAIGR